MRREPIGVSANYNAYVLPTLGNYSVYVDVDINEHTRKFLKIPHELRIRVYSPEKLSDGELVRIPRYLEERWNRYITERLSAKRLHKWLRKLAIIEVLIVSGAIAASLYFIEPPLSYLRAGINLIFWGILIFGLTSIIPGIRSWRFKSIEDKAERLKDNWLETEYSIGTEEEGLIMVKRLRDYYQNLDGKEEDIYKEMLAFSRKNSFKPAEKFYKWKIKKLTEEESFFTKYIPSSWKRKLKNLILGPDIEPPVVVIPVKNLDKEWE